MRKKGVSLISEYGAEANLRRLAAVTIRQAVNDFRSQDPLRALDAFLWLSGEEADVWFEAASMQGVDRLKFIASGRARRLAGRLFR